MINRKDTVHIQKDTVHIQKEKKKSMDVYYKWCYETDQRITYADVETKAYKTR